VFGKQLKGEDFSSLFLCVKTSETLDFIGSGRVWTGLDGIKWARIYPIFADINLPSESRLKVKIMMWITCGKRK
jgi:hypothetical protein